MKVNNHPQKIENVVGKQFQYSITRHCNQCPVISTAIQKDKLIGTIPTKQWIRVIIRLAYTQTNNIS